MNIPTASRENGTGNVPADDVDQPEPDRPSAGPATVTETFPVVDGEALRISFTPKAIREHFADPDGPGGEIDGMDDAMLLRVGAMAMGDGNVWEAFAHALTAAAEVVREDNGLPDHVGMDWRDVLSAVCAVLPGEITAGHAGGAVVVRAYLPDGRNVMVTDGECGGAPFSDGEPTGELYVGLYASTEAADDGAAPVHVIESVPADAGALAGALRGLTGLPA